MNKTVMAWSKKMIAELKLEGASVLEIGSYNVNGTVRTLFSGGRYVGVDMRPGPGVDIVIDPNAKYAFKDEEFDVVVSTEVLEHDASFWFSFAEMARVLKRGGHMLVTARDTGFPHHDYPGDFYRFTPAALEHLMRINGLKVLNVCADSFEPGSFCCGIKL